VVGDGLAGEARNAQKAAGSLRVMISPGTAGEHVHRGHRGYGAVPDVPGLAPLTAAGPCSPGGVLAGPGLDAGLLVDAEQYGAGRLRYRSQIALALPKKAGSSVRLSQPRTRCGLMSASARIRPAWLAETGT
jgi:hypothetical protein